MLPQQSARKELTLESCPLTSTSPVAPAYIRPAPKIIIMMIVSLKMQDKGRLEVIDERIPKKAGIKGRYFRYIK